MIIQARVIISFFFGEGTLHVVDISSTEGKAFTADNAISKLGSGPAGFLPLQAAALLQPGLRDAPPGVGLWGGHQRSVSGGSMTGWETPPSAPLLIEPTMGDYPDIQCPKMDEWQKGEKIGSGGFGSVYKCLNRKGEFFVSSRCRATPRILASVQCRAWSS